MSSPQRLAFSVLLILSPSRWSKGILIVGAKGGLALTSPAERPIHLTSRDHSRVWWTSRPPTHTSCMRSQKSSNWYHSQNRTEAGCLGRRARRPPYPGRREPADAMIVRLLNFNLGAGRFDLLLDL